MSKTGKSGVSRTLGAKAYAKMAAVEGLRLGAKSNERLGSTRNMGQEARREAVRSAYAAKPARKR